MRFVALAVVGLALAAGVAAATTRADAVTLFFRQYVNPARTVVMVWYGQVSSGAGGEDVEILGRECLTPGFGQLFATRTDPGGSYMVENPSPTPTGSFSYVEIKSGTTFRARWRNEQSAPVTWRRPLLVEPIRISTRRWRVRINPAPVYMNLAGRFVELQRLRSGRWVRYKRARLVRKPNFEYGGATNHVATFEVPTRGLRLRAFVPGKTVAPCYLGGPSAEFRS